MQKIAYVGIDYHLKSLCIAVVIEGQKDFFETIHLKNIDKVIAKYLKQLSQKFDLRLCYEAGSSGYAFQRKVTSWGYHCDVIAPSLVPKKPGNRRKNDFRDARDLAYNYAVGMLTTVHLPSTKQEALRSLVRCRLAFKESIKRVKHQINSLVMSQGFRWSKPSKWTQQHRQWLTTLQMPEVLLQEVLQEYLTHLNYMDSRLCYLDAQIDQIAEQPLYATSVRKLRAFKGISTLTAMVLIAELTDFRRFPSARSLMAFLGLIPSEHSSGDKTQGGSITKAGNKRCRRMLIEAVQHCGRSPHVTTTMKKDLAQVDADSANIAVKCLKRLHRRYWSLTMKGKMRPVVITAVARELVGFIWATMQTDALPA
jgi:transposase